jgi:hypothetical protein
LHPLSKTICLGVIVLALQILRGLKFFRCPRIVLAAARALGVILAPAGPRTCSGDESDNGSGMMEPIVSEILGPACRP